MKTVILDTDLGTDSDDIGALMVLHNLCAANKAEALAVTSCTSPLYCAQAIDAINRHYKRPLPVGSTKTPFHCEPWKFGSYARAMAAAYPGEYTDETLPDAVTLLRKTLAAAKSKITLISIGPLNNLAALIDSPADAVGADGKTLVQDKVDRLYAMAGNFVEETPEWNVAEDIYSAQRVAEKFLAPIVFCPFEAGRRVMTGLNALSGALTPMKLGYFTHNYSVRESWDPLTVYLALVGEGLTLSGYGDVSVDDKGVSRFTANAKGNRRYLLNDFDAEEIRVKLEELMAP